MQNNSYKGIKAITAWDEGNTAKLLCKVDGKRKTLTIDSFEWYFAITKLDEEKEAISSVINRYYEAGVVRRLEDYKTFVKIYCYKQIEDKKGRLTDSMLKAFHTDLRKAGATLYEADLSIWKRFITDNQIEVEGNLDVLYIDIETDDSHGGIVIGRDEILSFAAVNTGGTIFYYDGEEDPSLFKNMPDNREKRVLQRMINVIMKHDVIAGWNSNNFDVPYIKARMAVHGLEYDWRKTIHIDMMQRCARIYSYNMFNIGLKGFSLNEVSRVFLGEQKVEHEQSIKQMYDTNKPLLKKYNIKDVTLLRDLDKKLLVTDLMIKECQWTGAFLNRFFIGELLDHYILRKTRELGTFQYSRPDNQERESLETVTIRGGYVMTPVTGLFENVRVCDFKSLYPSIIVGFNIGRDALNTDLSDDGFVALSEFLHFRQKDERKIEDVPFEEWWKFLKSEKKRLDPKNEHIQTANNAFFRRDMTSFIGGLVNDLLEKRAMWKAQAKGMSPDNPEYISIQQSQGLVKEMANSMFGITGDKGSRYFNQQVSEAITLTGQFMNRLSSYSAKKRGYTTIYGDTDSIFIPVETDKAMDDLIDGINVDLKKFLDNTIQVKQNIVLLQYEKKFSKLIMLEKKRYSGRMVLYDGNVTDKIFSRGTENVKNNTIPLARKAMVQLINSVVTDAISKEKAREWMLELKNKVMNEEIDVKELLILTRISKNPAKYKSKQTHVRLAERLIAAGKMEPVEENRKSWGTRLTYIATLDKTTNKQEGILQSEYTGEWDRNYYWDVQVYAPIRRVLETVWPEEDWSQYSIADAERQARHAERDAKKKIKEDAIAQKKIDNAIKKQKREEELVQKQREREERKKKLLEKKQQSLFTNIE